MIIDTTEIQDIHSFAGLESLNEVYGILWVLVPILILILGITISVLAIVWLEREISAGIQQRIGPEYALTIITIVTIVTILTIVTR